MTHTPGPWEVGKVVLAECDDRAFVMSTITGESITGWGCVTQSRANAALIAAAPELLEACEDLLQFYIDDVGDSQYLDKYRAIIDKAKVE